MVRLRRSVQSMRPLRRWRQSSAMSFQDPDSEISRLNRRPGQWQAMSGLTLRVLRLARGANLASQNRFNCTVGGQLNSWALPTTGRRRGSMWAVLWIWSFAGGSPPPRGAGDAGRHCKGFCGRSRGGNAAATRFASGWVNAGGDLRLRRARTCRSTGGNWTASCKAWEVCATARCRPRMSCAEPGLLPRDWWAP